MMAARYRYRTLLPKPLARRSFRTLRKYVKDNIKMDVMGMVCEDPNYIELV
jgi:hypothetical protein